MLLATYCTFRPEWLDFCILASVLFYVVLWWNAKGRKWPLHLRKCFSCWHNLSNATELMMHKMSKKIAWPFQRLFSKQNTHTHGKQGLNWLCKGSLASCPQPSTARQSFLYSRPIDFDNRCTAWYTRVQLLKSWAMDCGIYLECV